MLIAMRYAYEVLRVETVVTYVVLLLVTTCTVIKYYINISPPAPSGSGHQ